MKVIKFRRLNQPLEIGYVKVVRSLFTGREVTSQAVAIRRFEIAFNEAHLHAKLDGEMAEIHMPAKGVWTRLWQRFFPLKGIEMQADGIEREVTL